MMSTNEVLIEAVELARLAGADGIVIADCRFDLNDHDAAFSWYVQGHIPGAQYVHLENELSGPPVTDSGRHPLPTPEALRELFGRLGIESETKVVAYDDASGLAAARLWWLLQFMGHDHAAVLNGGINAWIHAGFELQSGINRIEPVHFQGTPRWDRVVLIEEVGTVELLVDSRAPERYRGEVEPIDPVAGHIPGAINHFYGGNVGSDGRFLSKSELYEQFSKLINRSAPEEVVFYCGSGVTACNNLLAMTHAGMRPGRLYAGSWSEWCRQSDNPIATG